MKLCKQLNNTSLNALTWTLLRVCCFVTARHRKGPPSQKSAIAKGRHRKGPPSQKNGHVQYVSPDGFFGIKFNKIQFRTPLGELTTLPQTPSRLGRGKRKRRRGGHSVPPPHCPPHSLTFSSKSCVCTYTHTYISSYRSCSASCYASQLENRNFRLSGLKLKTLLPCLQSRAILYFQ